jgi:large subunit ribosomal protein L3
MTQAWTAAGVRLPLTVLWFDAPAVTHIKSLTKDGVDAVQVSCGAVRPKNAHGRTTGHCARAGLGRTARHAVEFRVTPDAADGLALGTPLSAAHFAAGQYVDVVGTTIGKGFQGVMKRWGFGGQPASHGTSKAHRSAGGIGGCQDPGKVWKGKKMAGRMGGARRTAQSLFVYKVWIDGGGRRGVGGWMIF